MIYILYSIVTIIISNIGTSIAVKIFTKRTILPIRQDINKLINDTLLFINNINIETGFDLDTINLYLKNSEKMCESINQKNILHIKEIIILLISVNVYCIIGKELNDISVFIPLLLIILILSLYFLKSTSHEIKHAASMSSILSATNIVITESVVEEDKIPENIEEILDKQLLSIKNISNRLEKLDICRVHYFGCIMVSSVSIILIFINILNL